MKRAHHQLASTKVHKTIGKTNSLLTMKVYKSLLNMHPVDAIQWGVFFNYNDNKNV